MKNPAKAIKIVSIIVLIYGILLGIGGILLTAGGGIGTSFVGIGVLLWLWMVLVNWKKHPVEIETVEGLKKFQKLNFEPVRETVWHI